MKTRTAFAGAWILKFPFSSADTALEVPLTVTVAKGIGLPSALVTLPVTVLLCPNIINEDKKNKAVNKIFFMQTYFLLNTIEVGINLHDFASMDLGSITKA